MPKERQRSRDNVPNKMMPDREIGVVVLTNRDPCHVRELTTYAAFDRLCLLSPIDWFDIFHARRQSALEKEEADASRFDTTGIVVPYPDVLLNYFIGEYSNPAYGTISTLATHPACVGVGGALKEDRYIAVNIRCS